MIVNGKPATRRSRNRCTVLPGRSNRLGYEIRRSLRNAADVLLAVAHGHAHELDAVRLRRRGRGAEVRRLDPARRAPRTPEVEHDDLAVLGLQVPAPAADERCRSRRGADLRSAAAMVWPVGVPLTNRNSPPAAWSTASDPVVQPTSVASDAVSSSTSRREYRRTRRVSPPNLELTHPGWCPAARDRPARCRSPAAPCRRRT